MSSDHALIMVFLESSLPLHRSATGAAGSQGYAALRLDESPAARATADTEVQRQLSPRQTRRFSDEDMDLREMEDVALHDSDLRQHIGVIGLVHRPQAVTSGSAISLLRPITYRDRRFFIGFVSQLVFTLIFILQEYEDEDELQTVETLIRIFLVLAMLYGGAWLTIFLLGLKQKFVWLSHGLSMAAMSLLGIIMLFTFPLMACIFFYIVFQDILWALSSRSRFDFVGTLLDMVSVIIQQNPAVIVVTGAALLLQTAWLVLWTEVVLEYLSEGSLFSFFIFVMLFHFYWTSNVFKGIVTFVVSGVVMVWFYDQPDPDDPKSRSKSISGTKSQREIVFHFLENALSTSFGTVCHSSLLSPPAHLLWRGLRASRRWSSSSAMKKLLEGPMVQRFISRYHKYSVAHIAGYNKAFRVAASDSWALIRERGVESIIDDDLSGKILQLGVQSGAGLFSVMFYLLCPQSTMRSSFALLYFFAAYSTISLTTQLVSATVKTLFVCFAENPGRLSQLNPLIYHRLVRMSELRNYKDSSRAVDLGETDIHADR